MKNAILAINPGTTTARCALYSVNTEGLACVVKHNLDHVCKGACEVGQSASRFKSSEGYIPRRLRRIMEG